MKRKLLTLIASLTITGSLHATDLTIANADFAADSDWTKGGTATITSGIATLPDASSYVEQTLTGQAYQAGKLYILKCESTSADGSQIAFYNGTTLLDYALCKTAAPREFHYYVETGNAAIGQDITIRITGNGTSTQDIDNIKLIEASVTEYSNIGVDNNMGGGSWTFTADASITPANSRALKIAYQNGGNLTYTFNGLTPTEEYVLISTYYTENSDRQQTLLADSVEIYPSYAIKKNEVHIITTSIPQTTYESDGRFVFTVQYDSGANSTCSEVILTTKSELGLNKIAEYKFNETSGNAADSTTVTGDATLIGANITRDGNSYQITATDSYIQTPSLGLTTNTITLSTWIKPDTITDWTGILIDQTDRTGLFMHTANGGEIRYMWGDSHYYTSSSLPLITGQWNFVALVVTPTGATLYSAKDSDINLTSFTHTTALTTRTLGNINIGRDNGDGRNITGYLENTRIWNYALNANELTAIFEADVSELSPVIGLTSEVISTKDGIQITWDTEEETDVKEYIVKKKVNKNWQIIEVVAAGEEYLVVDTDTNAEEYVIEVVDYSGYKQSFSLSSDERVYIDLTEGWNLVSIPFAIENINAWTWNGSSYEETDNLNALQGAWIYANKATQLEFTGSTAANRIELSTGWTLAGPAQNSKAPLDINIWGWDKGYQTTNILSQGKGYWFYSETDQTITLSED